LSRPKPRIEQTFGAAAGRYWPLALLAAALCVTIIALWLMRERPVSEEASALSPTSFEQLEGWRDDDQAEAFEAFVKSCRRSKELAQTPPCVEAMALAAKGPVSREAARVFFEKYYTPFEVGVGSKPGLLTGYYEPEVRGSRERTGRFKVPVLAKPSDLVAVTPDELRGANNDRLTAMRKADGELVPYYTREEIDQGALDDKGLEILYLDDPIELFFMQVQGSGRVRMPDGSIVRLGYAGKNGHPYISIGKLLVERGETELGKTSMQAIKEWLRADAERAKKLMWENPSYVFFEERPDADVSLGPVGAQGVALTPERSIAVDPSYHALGTPVFVLAGAGLKELDGTPFQRLMIAQDVGSAIRGPERGDIFFGSGEEAGARAGTTLVPGDFIVLKPKDAGGN
jgi:membrane-bound lytic murein transglycosylase A